MKAKRIIPLILILLMLAAVFSAGTVSVNANIGAIASEYQVDLYRAKVLEIAEERVILDTVVQTLKIEILNREYRGRQTTISNTIVENSYEIRLKKGDRISVNMIPGSDGEPEFYFNGYDRAGALLILCLVFAACVIILGRFKGVKALAALALTIALILFGLVPLLLRGYNPILLSIITCMVSAVITFSICFGFNKKSISAMIGVSGGLLIGGIIAYLFGVLAKITGFSHGDAQMLQYLPNGYLFDFKGLLFAGIIIGALGACTDIAISIASSLNEIKSHNPAISERELITSGFNIGRDIMGTMVNTLVLAYTGSSLATILIFMGFEKGFNEILNLESISTELVRAISGSLGLLFSIPVTIFAYIFIERFIKNNKKGEQINEK